MVSIKKLTQEEQDLLATEAQQKAAEDNSHIVSVTHICELLGVSRPRLYTLMSKNKICGHFRVGDFILFDMKVARPFIDRWLGIGLDRITRSAEKFYKKITRAKYTDRFGGYRKGCRQEDIEDIYYIDPMDSDEYRIPAHWEDDLAGYASQVATWRYSLGEQFVLNQQKYTEEMYAARLLGSLKVSEAEYTMRTEGL